LLERPGAAAPAAGSEPRLVLPKPTGSASVGTLTFELPVESRRLVLQVWYPAEPTSRCTHLPYMDARTAHAKTADGEQPAVDFSTTVAVNACTGAAPAAAGAPFPVVLFSHGIGATRFSYQSLYEDLASRGYAVVAIQHPTGARYTAYADGSAVSFDAETSWTEDQAARKRRIDSGLEEWRLDSRAVLARLESLKPGDTSALAPLAGRLDLGRIGYAGHSFGGATAMIAATSDPRIRAVANLDGRFPSPEEPVLKQPLLALWSSPRQAARPPKPTDVIAQIAGATHITFGDQTLLAETFEPAPTKPDPAALRGLAGIAITRAALGDFFDCTLRNEAARCETLKSTLARVSASTH